MIHGIGMDVCPARRWQRMIDRFGAEKCCRRILAPEEALYLLQSHPDRLAERLAGRWALREAFGKSLGVGMDGWHWKELRYLNGRLWSEGTLKAEGHALARVGDPRRSYGLRLCRSRILRNSQ